MPDALSQSDPNTGLNTTGQKTHAHIHIRIVMATHNGAAHLQEQLASIAAQQHQNWSLFIGDDGSSDATRDIVRAFEVAHPQRDITLVDGPCQGSAANFLSQAATAHHPGAWLAFADQDDVWMPHKLARALDHICPASEPDIGTKVLAYSSRSVLTDAALNPLETSPLHPQPTGFGNALVQNVLSGFATVLSPAAAALVAQSVPHALAAQVPFHDWWVYQLITGAGGDVILDPKPGLYYRQHASNILGRNRGVAARLARFKLLTNKDYAGWIDCNLKALTLCAPLLMPDALHLIDRFGDMRTHPTARARIRALADLGIYRQSPSGDLVLRLLARAGRL